MQQKNNSMLNGALNGLYSTLYSAARLNVNSTHS